MLKKRKIWQYKRFWLSIITVTLIIMLTTYNTQNLPENNMDNKIEYAKGVVEIYSGDTKITSVEVEIADSPDKQELGLMNRDFLPHNSGMLFIFNNEDYKSFWMKDTRISLDIIYIDSQFIISDIFSEMKPFSEKPVFSSRPVKYVLEVNGGYSLLNNIKNGDRITFRIN